MGNGGRDNGGNGGDGPIDDDYNNSNGIIGRGYNNGNRKKTDFVLVKSRNIIITLFNGTNLSSSPYLPFYKAVKNN